MPCARRASFVPLVRAIHNLTEKYCLFFNKSVDFVEKLLTSEIELWKIKWEREKYDDSYASVTVSALPTVAQHAYTHAPAHYLLLLSFSCPTTTRRYLYNGYPHTQRAKRGQPHHRAYACLYGVRPLLSPYYAALPTNVQRAVVSNVQKVIKIVVSLFKSEKL